MDLKEQEKELSPDTGLPKDNDGDSVERLRKNSTDPGKGVTISKLRKAARNRGLRSVGERDVQGAFGDYDSNIFVTSDTDFNELRAQGQSVGKLFTNSVIQSAGTVVGMGLEGIGFLGEIPQTIDAAVTQSELEFERNPISAFGKEIQEASQEFAPIYKTDKANSGEWGRFFDGTYIASMAPSVMSTVAMFIPGFAGAKAGAGLARLLRLGRKGIKGAATMGATLTGRHAEGFLEGFESHEIDFQRAIENGFSTQEAKKFAEQSAGSTYRMGYSNLLMDAMSWGALLRPISFSSRALQKSIGDVADESGDQFLKVIANEMRKNPFLGPKEAAKKLGFSWKDYLAQSGMEGFEEFNQEFIKRINSHNADINMGLSNQTDINLAEAYFTNKENIMGEQLQDPKSWDAALAGFVGGAVFQGIGHVWNKQNQEAQARQTESLRQRGEYIQRTLQDINSALNRDDKEGAKALRDKLVLDMAINGVKADRANNEEFYGSAVDGTLGNTMEMFAGIAQMDDNQLQELGMAPEARESAGEILKDLEFIGEKLDGYYENTIGTGADSQLAILKTAESFNIRKGEENLADAQEKLEKLDSESGIFEGLNDNQASLLRAKRELDAKQQILEALKQDTEGFQESGMNPFRTKILGKAKQESIETLEAEIQELVQQISNIVPKERRSKALGKLSKLPLQEMEEGVETQFTKEEVDQALSIYNDKMGKDSKARSLQLNAEGFAIERDLSKSQLASLNTPDIQADLVTQLEGAGEKLRQQAYTGMFKKAFSSGEYINKDGKLYRVRHNGEAISKKSYSRLQQPEQSAEGITPQGPILDNREARVQQLKDELEDRPSGDQIELIEVNRDLTPVEGAEYFTPEDVSDYATAETVLPDRVYSEEQADTFRKALDKALKENRFSDVNYFITDILGKSNYADRATNVVERVKNDVIEKIQSLEDYNQVMNLFYNALDSFPSLYSGEFVDAVQTRIDEIREKMKFEIDAIDKAIDQREESVNEALSKIQEIDTQIAEEQADFEDYVDSILSLMAEKGEGVKFDGRTNAYKDLVKDRKELDNTIESLKQQQKDILAQAEQVDIDKKILMDLKEKIGTTPGKPMPSVLIEEDFNKLTNAISSLRAKMMIRTNITEENLSDLQKQYAEAEDIIDDSIRAIEGFRNRVKNIEDASGIIATAVDNAYQEMLDKGLLTGEEARTTLMPEDIFNNFRMIFNKHLTETIRSSDLFNQDLSDTDARDIRKLINDRRIPSNSYAAFIELGQINDLPGAHWALLNADTPINSQWYRDEEVAYVKDAKNKLRLLKEHQRKAITYKKALNFIAKELDRESRAVKGETKDAGKVTLKSKGDKKITEYNAPQRILKSVFNRPAGSSGDNQNPNEDPSQRRYFRYINRTNFNQEPHELRIVKSSETYNIPTEGLEEFGYDPDEALFGIIMQDGKFVDENGELFATFDPERALYTAMPLATYETLSSIHGKTFDPESSDYLKTLPGKTKQEKLDYYEQKKRYELEKYQVLLDQWNKEIQEEGYTERDILGKSRGVAIEKRNARQYSSDSKPNPLSDVVDNPKDLEFDVSTTGVVEQGGTTVNVPEGFVQLFNPKTGNYFEGAVRRLESNEVDMLLYFLTMYVKQSTINKNGRINVGEQQKKAVTILDEDGNPMEKTILSSGEQGVDTIFRDYVNSFDKGTAINYDTSKLGRKVPGGRIRIQGQAFDIFADNPDGDGKINELNTNLIDALRAHLSERLFHVRSINVEKNEPYNHYVIDKSLNVKVQEYDSYTDFLVDNNVVGTWRKGEKTMDVVKDGVPATEDAYLFKNQQVIFDNSIPEELEPEKPKSAPKSTEALDSLDNLREGYAYVTNTGDNPIIYKTHKVGDVLEITIANEADLTEAQLEDALSQVEVMESIEAGDMTYTSPPKKAGKTSSGGLNIFNQKKSVDKSGKKETKSGIDFTKDRPTYEGPPPTTQESETSQAFNDAINEAFNEDVGDDVDPPFQLLETPSTVDQGESEYAVVKAQFEQVANQLSEATGLPVHVMNPQQGYDLIKELEASGEIKPQKNISPDNVPYGMYHRGEVYVFSKGKYSIGTLFHEVGHPLINQIIEENPVLWDNLQTAINNSARLQNIKKHVLENYPNPTDEFGDLTTSAKAEIIVTAIGQDAETQFQKEQERSFIQKIFDAIKRFLNKTFGEEVRVENLNSHTKISELANLLLTGKPIRMTPQNVTSFQRKEMEDAGLTLPGNKSVKFTQDAMKFVDYLFFDELFTKQTDKLYTLFTQEANDQLRRDILEASRKRIIKGAQVLQKMQKEGKTTFQGKPIKQQLDNYAYLLYNFEAVEEMHKKHLNKFHIETVVEEDWKAAENEKDSNALFQRESVKFSAKQNATSAVRFLVASLKSTQNNETFAGPQNVDFGETFNLLANHLSGTTTLQEKITILEELRNEDGIQNLQDRLFNKDVSEMTKADIGTAMYLLQFNETFSKHYNDYTFAKSDEGAFFKAIDATVNTSRRVIKHEWESNIFDKPDIYTIEGGRVIYDKSYFNEKYPDKKKTNDYIIIKDGYVTKEQEKWMDDEGIHGSQKGMYRNHFRTVNFLSDIGIDFSFEAKHTLPGSSNTSTEERAKFNERAQHVLNQIKTGQTPDIFADDSDTDNDIKAFLTHEIEHSNDRVENQHYNLNGETVYNVVLNHYISMVEDTINNVDNLKELQQKLPHLFNTNYTNNSLLLNNAKKDGQYFGTHSGNPLFTNLFDENGDRIHSKEFTVEIMEGVSRKTDAVSFHDMSFTDKIHMSINAIMQDKFPIFRTGDKKLERFMNAEFLTNKQIKTGSKKYQIFKNYLVDELQFIVDNKENRDYSGLNNLKDNPIEMSILPKLFSSSQYLKTKMEKAIDTGDISEFISPSRGIMNHIEKVFDTFVENEVENTEQLLEEYMIVEKVGEEYLNNGLQGLTKNKGQAYNSSQLKNILRKVIINRFIANIEQTKLFTAHPAFYSKNAKDMEANIDNFFHRMSGGAGTKKNMAVGHIENDLIDRLLPAQRQQRLYEITDSQGNTSITTKYTEGARPIIRSLVASDVKVTNPGLVKRVKEYTDNIIPYEGMEESDAMGLVTLDTYRDMKIRAAEWNENLERLYAWENRPKGSNRITHTNWITQKEETVTAKDLKNSDGSRTVFTMLKPQYFGPSADNREFVPAMYKLAVLPILPSYQNPAMADLRQYMEENNYNLFTFESANKVGTLNPGQDAYGKDGLPSKDITPQDSYYEYWGLQLQTGNKMKSKVTLGSQFMKQIISGIYDQGEAPQDLVDMETDMRKTHRALIEKGKAELVEELGLKQNEDGNYTLQAVDNLVEFLRDQAMERDVPVNVIDSIQLIPQYIQEGKLGLTVLSNRDKIENILASIADSRVITQKVNGGPKVQAASTFFEEGNRVDDKGNILPNDLKFYEDEGVMEVYMPHYFKEMYEDNPEGIANELLQAVGFRIPTSGLNVIERIKIKGFLPQSAGETIVLPTAIVAKAGSDFDVDKLNILLPNYYYNRKTKKAEYIPFIEGDTTKKETLKKLYEAQYRRDRELLDLARRKLEKAEKFTDEFFNEESIEFTNLAYALGITPSVDYTRAELIAELEEMGLKGINERLSQIPTPQEYVNENKGKDIYELNTREALENKLLSISYDIMGHENSKQQMFDPIGINKLEDQKDRIQELRDTANKNLDYSIMVGSFSYYMNLVQRNIESIAGTGIAALHVSDHVHSTKHNYLMSPRHETSFDHNTGGVDGELISLGGKYNVNGESISNLLNQITNMFIDGVKNPISNALNLNLETVNTALYMIRAGMSERTVFNLLNQPIIRDYIRLKEIRNSAVNQGGDIINSNRAIINRLEDKYAKSKSSATLTDALMEKYMKPKSQKGDFKKFQRKILDEFIQLEEGGRVLNEYVQATRIDTQAMGRNTSELDLMLRKLQKIETAGEIINSDKLLKGDGFLAPHYEALKSFDKMFTPFFIHKSNPTVNEGYENFLTFVDKKQIPLEEKVKLLDMFKADYISYVVLEGDTQIDGQPISRMGGSLELFTGKTSLPKRIAAMKKKGSNNALINNLLPVIGREKINGQFIDNLKFMEQRLDTFEQDTITMAWRELMSTHPQTARDLIRFTMQQSGLQLSPMTFTKYIPANVYMDMLNDAFTKNPKLSMQEFLEKFFENNYHNENLVPTDWSMSAKNRISGSIVKKFPLKEGVNQNQIGEMLAKGQRPWSNTPLIIVRGEKSTDIPEGYTENGVLVGDYMLFEKGQIFKPFAIKDFRNNQSLLSYGLKVTPAENVEYQEVDKPTLTKEQREAQLAEVNKSAQEETQQTLDCS